MTDGRKGQDESNDKIPEEDYVKIRLSETRAALKELNVENQFFLNLPDQDLVSNPFIIDKLFLFIKNIKPDFILVPPWEGAHPDHDTAHLFTIIAACNINYHKQNIIEYGSYNNYEDKFKLQEFIPKNTDEYRFNPSLDEQKTWLKLMKIFNSQKHQQEHYIPKSKFENYRQLPDYDYSKLPYSRKHSDLLRDLFPYQLAKRFLSSKDKLFYETWADIDPRRINKKLIHSLGHY